MAILISLRENEKHVNESTNILNELEKLIQNNEIAWLKKEVNSGPLVLNFETKHPDTGNPIAAVMGMTTNKFPNCFNL